MTIRIFQKGFNYSQDGPGNRLVYHMQGCNLHCPWCANPEGMSVKPFLVINGRLLDSYCPYGAIRDGKMERSICESCGGRDCVALSQGAVHEHKVFDIPLEDVVAEAVSCRPMFFDGGGVTFTGGEPTVQWRALAKLLPMLKAASIHTAIETNGTHPELEKLFPYIDYLIMDLKHADPKAHMEYTGMDNEIIKGNIKKAASKGRVANIRIPLIHHVNDSPKNLEEFVLFFKTLNASNFTIELLRYHEYGKDKWERCGLKYTVTDGFVSDETVRTFADTFRSQGFSVILS